MGIQIIELWQTCEKLSFPSLIHSFSALSTGIQDTLAGRLAEGFLYGKAHCVTCQQKDQCQMVYSNRMLVQSSFISPIGFMKVKGIGFHLYRTIYLQN